MAHLLMNFKNFILAMRIKTIVYVMVVLFLIGFFYGRCNHG